MASPIRASIVPVACPAAAVARASRHGDGRAPDAVLGHTGRQPFLVSVGSAKIDARAALDLQGVRARAPRLRCPRTRRGAPRDPVAPGEPSRRAKRARPDRVRRRRAERRPRLVRQRQRDVDGRRRHAVVLGRCDHLDAASRRRPGAGRRAPGRSAASAGASARSTASSRRAPSYEARRARLEVRDVAIDGQGEPHAEARRRRPTAGSARRPARGRGVCRPRSTPRPTRAEKRHGGRRAREREQATRAPATGRAVSSMTVPDTTSLPADASRVCVDARRCPLTRTWSSAPARRGRQHDERAGAGRAPARPEGAGRVTLPCFASGDHHGILETMARLALRTLVVALLA